MTLNVLGTSLMLASLAASFVVPFLIVRTTMRVRSRPPKQPTGAEQGD